MHPNPKRIIPVVLIIAIAGIAFWLYTNRANAQPGDIDASGTIEATEITIAPELGGRVSEVTAREGETVTSGQTLVQLDTTLLDVQRDQAAASLAAAQANYASIENGAMAEQLNAAVARAQAELLAAQQALQALNDNAALSTAQAESDLAHARDGLEKAQQRYDNINHPDIEFYQDRVDDAQEALLTAQENTEIIDIGTLQASLQAAQDVLKTMEDRLGKIQAAINGCPECDPNRSVTVDRIPSTLNDAQDAYNDALNRVREIELKIEQAKRGNTNAVDAAQDALEDAQQNLDWAQRGPDSIDEAIALADLNAATAKLDNAQSHYDDVKDGPDPDLIDVAEARVAAAEATLKAAEAAASEARLDTAQAQVNVAQAALNLIETQLSKLTLVSPINGTVLARAIEPGEMLVPNAPTYVLADLAHLTITVYVPEDRYGTVTLGQTATVTVDSYPGESFTATVSHIADQAEFTPRNVQTADGRKTTVFAVRLSIDNPDSKLKPGMPADVSFSN
jgi:HlyD family secretion protein